MDEDEQKYVGVKGSSKVDWLSILPDSLLFKVLLNLPTKDVVKTSVYIPGLNLDDFCFSDFKTFVRFVDAFLGFNNESYLERFKLRYFGFGYDEPPQIVLVSRWIKAVVDRRVKHLVVLDYYWNIQMPPTLYTCESLVSLKLFGVSLASPMFVFLTCLKFMDLTRVNFANALDLETLISRCPVLENLYIMRGGGDDDIEVLRVCSQSLLKFTYGSDRLDEDRAVAITASRLQYLQLNDYRIGSFILNSTSSLVEADMDTLHYFSYFRFDPNYDKDDS